MSETEAHTTPPQCDRLLDYIYEELDEAGKRAFEEHLPTCARCQAEVASLGRARTAAKRVTPAVEPPANLTGALHAQLMHAASQRRPKRGVVLQLFRRVAQHPQMAAAAMFLVVGGAFAYSWRRAKLFPATPAVTAPAPVDTPKPTEQEGAVDKLAANRPVAEPLAEGAKAESGSDDFKKLEPAKTRLTAAKDKEKDAELALDGKPAGNVVLQTPQATYAVDRPAAKHHASAGAAPVPKVMRGIAKNDDSGNAFGDQTVTRNELAGGLAKGAPGGEGLGNIGGVASSKASGGGRAGAGTQAGGGSVQAAPSQAMAAPAEMQAQPSRTIAQTAPAAESPPPPPMAPSTAATSSPSYRRAPAKPAPEVASQLQQQQAGPAAAPAPVASGNTRDANGYYREKAPVANKPAAPAPSNIESQRKSFVELAKANRCAEAIKLFHELEQKTQFISPTERAQYVRCLTQTGRQQEAEQQLIELKTEKKASNADVQKLEEELDLSRAKQQRAQKRKATPAAADERVAEPPPQQAQQAPAATVPQASPPPSKAGKKATSY